MNRQQREIVPGLPPGTLSPRGKTDQPTKLRLLRYSREGISEQQDVNLAEDLASETGREVVWLDMVGLDDVNCLHQLGKTLGLHLLALEDTLNPNQRTKLDFYADHLYLCLKIPRWDGQKNDFQQISFFLKNNTLVTLSDRPQDYQQPILSRLQQENGQIRKSGADYLLYALLDAVIDNYFPWLECLARYADDLEEVVLESTDRRTMQEIHRLKREIVETRRHLWPLRETVLALARDDQGFVKHTTVPFLRDCQDHCLQQLENLDNYREVAHSLLDIHLSNLSNRMNEVMKVLTVISTIFIPLTFLAGVYGMNFEVMPELHWRWGYALCWLIMLLMALAMMVLFRRVGWLGQQKNILKIGKTWRFPVILSLEDYFKRAGKAILVLSESAINNKTNQEAKPPDAGDLPASTEQIRKENERED